MSCGSGDRNAIASGRTRLTSRTCTGGSSTCACSAINSRCSGPTSSTRSSSKLSAGRSPPWAGSPLRARGPGAATESAIPAVLRAGDTELVGQPHRHLVQQGRERGTVRLVRAQRLRFPCERGEEVLGPAPNSSLSRWCCSSICCRSSRCPWSSVRPGRWSVAPGISSSP